jgi:AbiU2
MMQQQATQQKQQPQQTDDQVLANNVSAMGPELGTLYHAISNELATLHWRWQQYRELFGEKPSRFDWMNQSASFFFHVFHDMAFESTILGIARLVGPPKSAGNQVVSIQRFISFIADDGLRADVAALVEDSRTAADFAMQWRHRRIAHLDLELALRNVPVEPLPEATRANVEAALASLRAVMGRIERAYCKSSTAYAKSPWGAQTLLYYVRGGVLRENEKRECWNRGERHADDINPLPPI